MSGEALLHKVYLQAKSVCLVTNGASVYEACRHFVSCIGGRFHFPHTESPGGRTRVFHESVARKESPGFNETQRRDLIDNVRFHPSFAPRTPTSAGGKCQPGIILHPDCNNSGRGDGGGKHHPVDPVGVTLHSHYSQRASPWAASPGRGTRQLRKTSALELKRILVVLFFLHASKKPTP